MLEQLVLDLYDAEMIKFGEFTLKSGKNSYIYADIRSAISHPPIFKQICELLASRILPLTFDFICGVPYSALTFASAIAYQHQFPMLLKRKEAKTYGTKKLIEGHYNSGQRVVIIEDVVTTGMSISETTTALSEAGLVAQDIVCLLERNQGGRENLARQGYRLHSILDLYQVIEILVARQKITAADKQAALALIDN